MPKTATPRKPETVSRKLAETRNTSKNRSLSSLLGIGDNEKRLATDVGSGLNDVIGRGTIAGLLGLPGDLGGAAENGLRSLLGLPQVVPYGGSEHIGQKLEQAGLVSDVRRPKTELLASLISPAQAATAGYKAPQMARAGVKALDNLSAPRTMGRQQGAIENLWHGTPHSYPAERLVRMPDGSEQYLVGGVDSLPPVPQGATPVRDFPLGRQRLDKIGTGEGAQAYGHGIYEAESEGVANSYKNTLGGPDKPVTSAPRQVVEEAVAKDPGKYYLAEDTSPLANGNAYLMKRGGHIYQTRLAWPDAREATDPLSPDHFLHWDKPLSEQSPMVQEAIRRAEIDAPADWDGGRVYGEVGFRQGPGWESEMDMAASEKLKSLGIPGIRYLDGGSRGAGAGSHNYVVFDDKLIDIVSRNGQPAGLLGKMVAPQDEALRVAQANAAKPEGLQGLLTGSDNAPMGNPIEVWHGTDVEFDTPQAPLFLGDRAVAESYARDRSALSGANPILMGGTADFRKTATDADVKQIAKSLGIEVENDMAFSVLDPNISGKQTSKKVIDALKAKGFDSAQIDDFSPDDPTTLVKSYVAFDPSRLNLKKHSAKP